MTPAHPRSLADATILQPVSKMRDDPAGHAAVDTALTLLQAGARAIVAGDGGPRGGRGASHGRPMIATAVGMLPENLLWPPRMRDELRIGWVVRPAIPASLRVRSARHCRLALPLTRRWARGRANSPNSCFRRKALLKLSAGCSRATPDRAGSCTSKSCTSRNGSRS
jgi:hypothetical protein